MNRVEPPYDSYYRLAGRCLTPTPIKLFLLTDNEVICGWEADELASKVIERFPESRQLHAEGQHDTMNWDIVSVFVVDDPEAVDGVHTVAYLWKERR